MSEPSPPPGRQDELGFSLPEPAQLGRRRGMVIVAVALVAVAAAFFVGYLPRARDRHALDSQAAESTGGRPRVEVFTPRSITSDRELTLPGSVEPLEETVLFPRVAGYVRRWSADIGDHVQAGQVLVEIDTPELDADLEKARADLAQAEAGEIRATTAADLSRTELDRYERLTPEGVASRQELEQRRSQAKVDQANIKVAAAVTASQQANLRRLVQQKSFARVLAPFSGIVISRSVERGALVSAGNATPLYRVAAIDPVRIFVQVPQDVAPSIRAGTEAKISVREYGGRIFEGRIARSAGALDRETRTLNTEVRAPNPKGELMAGMAVRVALLLPTPHRLFEVPATALFTGAQGTRVAVVDARGQLAMRKVGIERDTGNTLLIATGLEGSEQIVRLANAAFADGTIVEIIPPNPQAPKP